MGATPPPAVDERISKDGRHDSDAAAPHSTATSSLQGRAGVRPSRRIWSSWCLGRVQPGVQKSNPHALLVLLLRRPPCARECQCLLARLPPWRDVAAELQAPGVLHYCPSFSSHQKSRRASCLIDRNSCPHHAIKSFYTSSIYIRQRGLARPKFFFLRDGVIALGDCLACLPYHDRVS